jgi:hypothetical protein
MPFVGDIGRGRKFYELDLNIFELKHPRRGVLSGIIIGCDLYPSVSQ